MTQLTRSVVTDLWPLYAAGEASADTRALVEAFLAQDPDFARIVREETSSELLKPSPLVLPADHERQTLLRTQRRRALQSMIVNSLALLASAAMTAVYLWKVVPHWVVMFLNLGIGLPSATRFTIVASNWTVRLLPFACIAAAIALLFRKRIRLPESFKSGTALAILTGATLLLVQAGWLALMVEASTALDGPFRAGAAGAPATRALLAIRSGDYRGALPHLQQSRERLMPVEGVALQRQALASALLTGDAHRALGDLERARAAYQEAERHARAMLPSLSPSEAAQVEALVRSAREGLDAPPRQRP